MSISDEVQNLETNLANSYTAVSNKGGTLPQDQCFDNLPTAINSIQTGGAITSLNITPTTSAQTFTASGGIDGYSPVNVSAVTSAIDSNIQPQFIRNGVQILGITGEYGDPLPPQVACSDYTTWYVTNNGELYGCGQGNGGQQGSGDYSKVKTFTKRADNVVQVACWSEATWYINNSGELYGCGSGAQGSGNNTRVTVFTKRADNVVQVACSPRTTWYINSSGELYGCGDGYRGQQGDGTSSATTFTKRADNVKQVACSRYTTWYINESGELYGCGYNNHGQQGSGDTSDVYTFTKRADNVVFVACTDVYDYNGVGNSTTWYINEDGELYSCGYNNCGQQGSGDTSDVYTFTKRADNVVQVACSGEGGNTYSTTWYINSSGELYGCGFNYDGQQGSGSTSDMWVTTFTKRADNVKDVVCSPNTTWYINNSGELYGCGEGTAQGNGGSKVKTFTKRADNVVQVACWSNATWYCTQYDVYGCGYNYYGQQGSGDTTNVYTFTKRN